MSNKKIVYQGDLGAFSYIAGLNFFGSKNKFWGVKKFEEIFLMIKNKKADFGVIPIENSIAGSIYENYDLLMKYNTNIVGELYLKIAHNLLGIKLNNLTKLQRLKIIKKVFSHYKALEQCNKFFKKYNWIEKIIFDDTAGSAKFVSASQNPSYGAIASRQAAKIYNLDIILKNIEDNKSNYTRFLIITNKKIKIINPNKCSLAFYLRHKPGTLYKALAFFAENKINLTKIESRPIIGKPFKYLFYLDFELNKKNFPSLNNILKNLKKESSKITILGLYKKGKYYYD